MALCPRLVNERPPPGPGQTSGPRLARGPGDVFSVRPASWCQKVCLPKHYKGDKRSADPFRAGVVGGGGVGPRSHLWFLSLRSFPSILSLKKIAPIMSCVAPPPRGPPLFSFVVPARP